MGASEGVVEREEREMIHKVFQLEDTQVRSVMVPRTDMFCLDVKTPREEILPALREHLHSRVPVYEGSIDVIVGVLYTKDLLPFVRGGLPPDFDLRAHLHPPYFVPESKRADQLLQEFQAKRLHLAIVVDEFGGTAGLVALEDLLEELVGEIADEYDEPERLVQRLDAQTYRVAGKLPIDELRALTGLKISDEDYDTVGGWVLDLFGRVPRKAERLETPDFTVTVEKVERTRVVEVLVTLRKPAPGRGRRLMLAGAGPRLPGGHHVLLGRGDGLHRRQPAEAAPSRGGGPPGGRAVPGGLPPAGARALHGHGRGHGVPHHRRLGGDPDSPAHPRPLRAARRHRRPHPGDAGLRRDHPQGLRPRMGHQPDPETLPPPHLGGRPARPLRRRGQRRGRRRDAPDGTAATATPAPSSRARS